VVGVWGPRWRGDYSVEEGVFVLGVAAGGWADMIAGIRVDFHTEDNDVAT
jgi:hypothetical protein